MRVRYLNSTFHNKFTYLILRHFARVISIYTSAMYVMHAYVAIICMPRMHANIVMLLMIRDGSLQQLGTLQSSPPKIVCPQATSTLNV